MTYEEIRELLAGLATNQVAHEARISEHETRMTEHEVKVSELEAEITEYRIQAEREMAELREGLAITKAIADSNARSIEAAINEGVESRKNTDRQIVELARIVGQYATATNVRLDSAEDRLDNLENP